MVATEQLVSISNFVGLQDIGEPSEIESFALSEFENAEIDLTGLIRSRRGFNFHSSNILVESFYLLDKVYDTVSFVDEFVVGYVSSIDTLYYCENPVSSSSWISIGVLAGVESAVGYLNILYIGANGGIYSWDCNSLFTAPAFIAGAPNANPVALHEDRVFAVDRASANANRLWFSEAGATSWPATNFIDIGTHSPITSVEILHDRVYIFKSDSIWVLFTNGQTSDWQVEKLSNLGTYTFSGGFQGLLDLTLVHSKLNALFFLGSDGLYRTDGVEVQKISEPVNNFFKTEFTITSTLESGIFELTEGVILIPFIESGDRKHLIYDPIKNTWGIWVLGSNTLITSSVVIENDSILLGTARPVGGGTTPILYELSFSEGAANEGIPSTPQFIYGEDELTSTVFTDAPFKISTKVFDFETPDHLKRLKWFSIDCKGGDGATNVTVTITTETGTAVRTFLPSVTTRKTFKLAGPGYFKRVKFTIEHPSPLDLKIFGMKLHMHSKRQIATHT